MHIQDNNPYGFYRFAAACPKMKVADTKYNTEQILECIKKAFAEDATAIVFPELCITGYTCNDLFHQELLLQNAEKAIDEIVGQSNYYDNILIVVGAPIRIDGRLYNCAVFIQSGSIIAITPKVFLPNQREFYEKRYFSSGRELLRGIPQYTKLCNQNRIPITSLIKFEKFTIGCELCEDLWVPIPPSGYLALSGATVIVNLSASDALVGKANYRRDLVCNQSARCMAGYVYASAGVHESTTDMVCSGHLIIAENGSLMAERNSFSRETEIVYADIDVERLAMQRISEGSFQDFNPTPYDIRATHANYIRSTDELKYRYVSRTPFVPSSDERRTEVCSEIFNIQCAALAKRLEASNTKRAVIGLSGGLDSTLALLVIYQTYKLLNRPVSDILAITMPGFGTTKRTKGNAEKMAECLGVELRTIDITKACMQHFEDIGHDPNVTDVTYENVQARERTQILMDVANKEKGIVIGTGDLSELALGWCTYNADHMSMYSVNCDIPKTLVRYLVRWYAVCVCDTGDLSQALMDILDTPVSPELLPTDKDGNIAQKTEEILGDYILHDFFLYHFVKYGATPSKMLFLAKYAFKGSFADDMIEKTLKLFLRRFFTQQFKRSCIPDGPKVGTLSLSPRADWRMPSDASFNDWLEDINEDAKT